MAQQVASLYADIGAKTDKFDKGAASVKGGLKDLAGAIGIVTSAIALMSQAFDLAKEGAQLQRLQDSGAELARQFGGNMDLIVAKVKEASLGTVSEMDIIASANKAMMLGLGADAEQLANLMEIAAFRGRAMGVSTTQAFDDIVRGIGRSSPLILDNLGIVVSLGDTYESYAKSLGKSSNELTKAEKTQALLNSVLNTGNKMLDQAGGLVEDNAAQYEKLTARMKDYQDTVKMGFSDAISPSIEGFLDMAEAMDKAAEATGRTDQRSKMYLGAMQLQLDKLQEEKNRLNAVTSARWEGIAATYASTKAIEENTVSIEDASAANESFLGVLSDMQRSQESFESEQKDLIEERMELEAEKQQLLAQGYMAESAEIQEINGKLEENSEAAQINADEHELANRRIILGLLERKLMQDGVLTDDELNWLLEKGQAWGIYSDTVIAETRAAMNEVNTLAAQINMLPTQKEISIRISTYGNLGAVGDLIPAGARHGGGDVQGGKPYLVGERGAELFMPGQDGKIVPNQNLGGGSGGVIVNVMLSNITPDPEKVAYELAPAIKRVLRQMQ